MRSILLATSILATSFMATSAYAQAGSKPAADANDNGEIIVTARLRTESLLNVPIAMSVSTKEQLDRAQVRSIDDLQRLTPALEISQSSGGESSGGGRIRGLGTGVFNHSVSPSVAFVVDDVSQGNLSFPLLFDLAKVEVLRGPQGTLFGQGASAGVVKVATVAPTTDGIHVNGGFEFANKGTAGSEFGNLVLNAGVNVPLGENLALRVAGQFQQETGLQRNVTTNKDNKITDFGVRAKLLFTPSSSTTIRLTGDYAKRIDNAWNFFAYSTVPTNGNAALLTACGVTPSPRAEQHCSQFPGYQARKAWGLSAVIEQKLAENIDLTSVTAYRTVNFNTKSVDYSRLVGDNAANRENIQEDSKQFSQELRLAYKGSGFDLIVGGMYQKYSYLTSPSLKGPFNLTTPGNRIGFSVCPYAGNFTLPFPPFTNTGCLPFIYGFGNPSVRFEFEDTKNTSYAAFADTTIKLSDQVDLYGGLRYSNYSNTTGVAFDALVAPAANTYTKKDNNLSGRIGLSYRPSSTSSVYLSYSRGYKPPAVTLTPGNPVPVFLNPEKSTALELGGRKQIGRVLLSGNLFYTKVKDFQAQTQIIVAGQLLSTAKNIESVTSYGFELNASGKLADNLTFNAGYQFNSATYPDGFLGDDGVSLAGAQVTNAPRHKVTLAGEYSFPMGGIQGFTNANMVYKSAVRIAPFADALRTYPAHAIVNIGFGVRDPNGKWNASVFVRNLTKQREPVAYLGSAAGGLRAWPGAGITARIVGLSGSVNF